MVKISSFGKFFMPKNVPFCIPRFFNKVNFKIYKTQIHQNLSQIDRFKQKNVNLGKLSVNLCFINFQIYFF